MSAWLDHLWQSTLLAVAVVLALAAGGRWLTAATRRVILAVTLGQFLVPGAWLASLIQRIAPPAHHWIQSKTLPIQLAMPALHRAGVAVAHQPGLAAAIWAIWAIGVAAVIAASAIKTARMRRALIEESEAASEYLSERWTTAARRARLPNLGVPACKVCAADRSPGVIGVIRPLLFVPAELEQILSKDELDAVLLHEAIHLERRDNLWSAAQTICAALNWYNPLVWFVSQQLQLETEMSCDERVLRVTAPGVYLNAIAKSVRHSLGLLAPGFSPIGSTPVGLRLGNILSFPPKPAARTAGPIALGLVAVATLMSGYAGSVTAAANAVNRSYAESGPERFAARADPGIKAISVLLVGPRGEAKVAPTPDVMPVAIERTEPAYPLAPRLAGISGMAAVKYTVDAQGAVKDVDVESADREDFGRAASEAIAGWRFVPAQRNGSPVAAQLEVQVVFSAQSPLPREVQPQDRPVAVSFR